jgi:hypothetical protein
LDWDADPVVTLTRRHIISVIERFMTGKMDATAVEGWANLVEARDDIEFESPDQEIIAAVIFELANPVLHGDLELAVTGILARLAA